MDPIIDEVEQFFSWMKSVYGNQQYLEGTLRNPEINPEQPKTQATARKLKSVAASTKSMVQSLSGNLGAFYQDIKDCQKCTLGSTRKNFVFGVGNPDADIVFVGEAPGKDEDEQGLPFVGKAGKLLDKMLAAISLTRDEVFIANVLKCRPPGNRDPLPDEVVQCEPYLQEQLRLISPKILVALGRISAQVLLKQSDSLSYLRKEVRSYSGIPLIVTYHPAALLRNPQWKRNAWEDLKKIRQMALTVQ